MNILGICFIESEFLKKTQILKFPLNQISGFDKLSCKEWDNWQSLKLLTLYV